MLNEALNESNDVVFRDIRVLYCNLRGFASKSASIERILKKEDVDIFLVTESHTKDPMFPSISGYTTFFMNRKIRAQGGTAILIKDSFASNSIRIDASDDTNENEYICVNLNNTHPKISVLKRLLTQSTARLNKGPLCHLSKK